MFTIGDDLPVIEKSEIKLREMDFNSDATFVFPFPLCV